MTEPAQSSGKAEDDQHRLEIYKLLVEMADRTSQRRQAANSFYLSVNTALVGGTAYFATIGPDSLSVLIISLAGLAISALWARSILSYKSLNEAKFAVITEIEKNLPLQPYTDEWKRLDSDDPPKHRPFHSVEILVPLVFAAIHGLLLFQAVPWSALCARVF